MKDVKDLLQKHKSLHDDFNYYDLHLNKIENNKTVNPDVAIESCKSLIEGVSKSILNRLDSTYDESKDISVQKLFKKALEKLSKKSKNFEATFVHSSGQIINTISEIRNKRGDISHGKSVPKKEESSPDFSIMISRMTNLIVSYTLEHFFRLDLETEDKLDYTSKKTGKYNEYLDELYPNFPITKISYSRLLYENDYDEYETRYKEYASNREIDDQLKEKIESILTSIRLYKELKEEKAVDKKELQVIVEVHNPTIKALIEDFTKDLFWTDDKIQKAKDFAAVNALIYDYRLQEMIENIVVFNDKDKLIRSDVANIMNPKPRLSEIQEKAELARQKIIEFAENLDKE